MTPELTAEERALALDLAQIVLDIVGIADPSPTADGVNLLISLGRGNWLDAGLSGISMVPYIGDLAKSGKLPGYLQTIQKAIARAHQSRAFDQVLRPVLRRLDDALEPLLATGTPTWLAHPLQQLREVLARYLGRTVKLGQANVAQLVDEVLFLRFGRVAAGSSALRQNVTTLVDFLLRHGVPPKVVHDVASGTDLHKPVAKRVLKKGERVVTYVDPAQGVGSWFTTSGHSPDAIGILPGKRVRETYEITQDVEVLESFAAAVVDTWTPRDFHLVKQRFSHRVTDKVVQRSATGQLMVVPGTRSSVGFGARGGGKQFFLPGKGAFRLSMKKVERP